MDCQHLRFAAGPGWIDSDPGDMVTCICRDCGAEFMIQVGEPDNILNYAPDEPDGATFTVEKRPG